MEGPKWHRLSVAETARRLQTDVLRGLDDQAVLERRRLTSGIHAANFFSTTVQILRAELVRPPLISLGLGVLFAAFLRHWPAFFVGLVLFGAVFGLGWWGRVVWSKIRQISKRERQASVTVIRGGERRQIPPGELVAGDLLLLSAGEVAPGEARIVSAHSLKIFFDGRTEQALVSAVSTSSEPPRNMLMTGAAVISGSGQALMVAEAVRVCPPGVGNEGLITPRGRRYAELAILANGLSVLLLIILFLVGWGTVWLVPLVLVFPAALVPAWTAILVYLAKVITREGGLINQLAVIENLSRVQTLILGRGGLQANEELSVDLIVPRSDAVGDREDVLWMGIMTAEAWSDSPFTTWSRVATVHGRPVERALIRAGLVIKMSPERIFPQTPRVDFLPFDSERGFAASLHWDRAAERHFVYFAGTPELLLARAKFFYRSGALSPMTVADQDFFLAAIKQGTERGVNFLATGFAVGRGPRLSAAEPISDELVFGGLIGLTGTMVGEKTTVSAPVAGTNELKMIVVSSRLADKLSALVDCRQKKESAAIIGALPPDLLLFNQADLSLAPADAPPALRQAAHLVLPGRLNASDVLNRWHLLTARYLQKFL